ncbi:MAG TPA: hypothetical protein VMO47_00660 [Rhodothermales bacterium]|nr:hypothetical protein [Rhodothermales bacterium]
MMPNAKSSKWNRILVALFFLVAILLAIWGSIEFKGMIDDDRLQEKLDEVRPSNRRS